LNALSGTDGISPDSSAPVLAAVIRLNFGEKTYSQNTAIETDGPSSQDSWLFQSFTRVLKKKQTPTTPQLQPMNRGARRSENHDNY